MSSAFCVRCIFAVIWFVLAMGLAGCGGGSSGNGVTVPADDGAVLLPEDDASGESPDAGGDDSQDGGSQSGDEVSNPDDGDTGDDTGDDSTGDGDGSNGEGGGSEQPDVGDADTYLTFEAPLTNPVRLSPSGQRLFVVNPSAHRLSVFSLESPANPVRIAEIPVGMGPVSVWPVNDDEAWVVNFVSGTVSIVSVSRAAVVETFDAGVEPADLVITGSTPRVFISESRRNAMRIYDPSTRALLMTVPLQGESPRSLAVANDGEGVFVAFALGGNGTTIMPVRKNPPAPENSMVIEGLPPAPEVGLIIDALDSTLNGFMNYTVLANDIALLDPVAEEIHYFERAGTVNFHLAVHPISGDAFLANTEAHNLRFFTPELRGQFVSNRITRISHEDPGVQVLPIDVHSDVAAAEDPLLALAQPTAIAIESGGGRLWVAAFGSDRVATMTPAGEIIDRIDMRWNGVPGMRGPRALALSTDEHFLYVLNRVSSTLAVIGTEDGAVLSEQPLGSSDPEPDYVRSGRQFLYDARLSGNGRSSCASCHVDGDTDNLAWNLGNPEQPMRYVEDPDSGELLPIHPLKGPLVTQSLTGLRGQRAFHWQGDLPTLSSFNGLFDSLMGGDMLSGSDMEKLTRFIASLSVLPNPNLELDGGYATLLYGADPAVGASRFVSQGCAACHTEPGRDQEHRYIQRPNGSNMMVASIRRFYRKAGYRNGAGDVSTIGFGVLKDGQDAATVEAVFDQDLFAFLMSWDTGVAPTVGHQFTVPAGGTITISLQTRWDALESGAFAGANGILVHGESSGVTEGLVFSVDSQLYQSCQDPERWLSRNDLVLRASEAGATLTVMGTHPGAASCGHFAGLGTW
jgi:DNA-binding beta-propeller fold protein YncE